MDVSHFHEFQFSLPYSTKYSGTFLVITGVIHTVYALLLGKEDFTDMIKDGLINSTDDSYSHAFGGG